LQHARTWLAQVEKLDALARRGLPAASEWPLRLEGLPAGE